MPHERVDMMIVFFSTLAHTASMNEVKFDLGTYVEVGVAKPRTITLRRDGSASSNLPGLNRATWSMDPGQVVLLPKMPEIDYCTMVYGFVLKPFSKGLKVGQAYFRIQTRTETISISLNGYSRKEGLKTSYLKFTADGLVVLTKGSEIRRGVWSLSNGLGIRLSNQDWESFEFPSKGMLKPRDGAGVFTQVKGR